MSTIIETTSVNIECLQDKAKMAQSYARMCEHMCTEILEELGISLKEQH